MKHVAESERFNHFCLNWVKSYIVAFEFVFLSILKQPHLSQSADLSVVMHCFRNKKPH